MTRLSIEEIVSLVNENLLGVLEVRNLLAEMYPEYAKVKDLDLDQHIRDESEREFRETWERLRDLRTHQSDGDPEPQ